MGYKMHQQRFRIAIGILACALVQIQGADTDEKRPYEFGFEVEVEGKKQQHRHEEKDKDGIIMGEFGFITADDVYHVTVYATDKDGRFKILSMKNIHLKSSSAAAQNSNARQGHSLGTPAIPATPTERISGLPPAPGTPSIASRFGIPSEMVTAQKNVLPQINTQSQFQAPITSLQPSNIRSCSSCSIPTTTPRAIPTNNFLQPNQSPYFPQGPTVSGNSIAIQKPSHNGSPESNSQLPEEPNQSYYPTQGFLSPGSGQPAVNIIPPSSVPSNVAQPGIYGKQYTNIPSSVQSSYPYGESNVREPKQFNGPKVSPTQERLPGLAKPKLVSVDMQIVDKNTDIDILQPGEKKGLPNDLNEEDISRLLYIFNYTVGFHGHYEEGYENGVKKGYYYVTGRNGVRTRIDYLADNTGFHPKVSQEILDLLSDDVPKPETEKDAKYGLKSYEFKWLYFPVGSERY